MRPLLAEARKVKPSTGTAKEARRAWDSSSESCWSYDVGDPSPSASVSLTVTLDSPCAAHTLAEVRATFAGGFVPLCVRLLLVLPGQDAADALDVWNACPRDGNMPQVFPYVAFSRRVQDMVRSVLAEHGHSPDVAVTQLIVRLEGSTDPFGRVHVYHLEVGAEL